SGSERDRALHQHQRQRTCTRDAEKSRSVNRFLHATAGHWARRGGSVASPMGGQLPVALAWRDATRHGELSRARPWRCAAAPGGDGVERAPHCCTVARSKSCRPPLTAVRLTCTFRLNNLDSRRDSHLLLVHLRQDISEQ